VWQVLVRKCEAYVPDNQFQNPGHHRQNADVFYGPWRTLQKKFPGLYGHFISGLHECLSTVHGFKNMEEAILFMIEQCWTAVDMAVHHSAILTMKLWKLVLFAQI
jgi:hypothetical protein